MLAGCEGDYDRHVKGKSSKQVRASVLQIPFTTTGITNHPSFLVTFPSSLYSFVYTRLSSY
jgi:hypothetical protein